MSKVFKIVFTMYLLINSITLKAIIKIDSLKNIVKNAPNDSIKSKNLSILIFHQIRQGLYRDAETNIRTLNYLAKKNKSERIYVDYYGYKGMLNRTKGNLDLAIQDYKKSIILAERIKDSLKISINYHNLGGIYVRKGYLDLGLNYLIKASVIKEKLGDKKRYANSLTEIGEIFLNQQDPICLDYFFKALNLELEVKNYAGASIALNSIADFYNTKIIDSALKYYNQSLIINKNTLYGPALSHSLIKIGFITLNNNPKNSFENFTKALHIEDSIKNLEGICECYDGLGNYYFTIKNFNKAKENFLLQLEFAKKTNVLTKQKEAYKNLYKISEQLNQTNSAYNYLVIYNQLKDSIFNEGMTRKLLQNEMSYKFKKQKEIDNLKNKEKENLLNIEINFQKKLKYFYLIIIAIVIFSALFILKAYFNKRKSNIELEEKNNIINQQKIKVEEQKEELQLKQKEIIDSITYAKRIQESLLPTDNYIQKKIKNNEQHSR